ncbi:MAG TPA: hypothetical protein GXX30_03390 [Firmicutes bacterium]|uniref:CNNM transmembrane domain-containing protein n=1 Tax=Candidatus Fermentithermobacillus carboniphilus TaxID=3085328 RepID=A0AAT9LCR8_9FIRM|nr:MAG: hypothetical protein IMF26_02285 [Candidatus Fermentithermobacillus carboniphilus]HHW17930.1 hypothetical protein [Candidatus Fermentithermobacillaceae bacterium]
MGKSRKSNKSAYILQGLWLGLGAFFLSSSMNAFLEKITENIPLEVGIPLFFAVVFLGIISDGIGLASARAKEESILSMASRKVRGARESLWFIRNASKVSSVFNDVMGDVAATLSGALAVATVYRFRHLLPGVSLVLLTSLGVGLASFLSVGGKAVFKPLALGHAESIVLFLGKVRYFFSRVLRRRGG